MRNAYALLGLAFLLVFGGAYLVFERAHAPAELNKTDSNMQLSSQAFANNETIPSEYTCDGSNTNPPLTISGVPLEAESLVLVMDDPDIPEEIKQSRGIEKFDHWVLYNLPADTTEIPAGTAAGSAGLNSRGEGAYTGPCPPTEYGPTTHRYIFRLYALSGQLNFIKAPTLDEVEKAAQGSALGTAELIGIYDRTK